MAPIQQYVGSGTLPLDSKEVAKVRLCVVRCLVRNELYRQSFMGPYLKCLKTEQATPYCKKFMKGCAKTTPNDDPYLIESPLKDFIGLP